MHLLPFKHGLPVREWLFAAATAVACGAYCATAIAADRYPTKPVRLIVPYSPGGGSDTVARIIGQKLTDSLGQSFVIDNRAGAAGMVGTDLAANSPADGYTLLLADAAYTINSSYYTKQARYDAVKSFVPVTLIADTPYLLMTHPGLPVVERSIDRSELYMADEMFECGSGHEISPIVSIDRMKIGDGGPGPITRAIQEKYLSVVRGKLKKYRRWLTPVY